MRVKSESEVAQSCPTLSDPMDCSLPGSSVHGIFQARVLEWGAIVFSAGLVITPQICILPLLIWVLNKGEQSCKGDILNYFQLLESRGGSLGDRASLYQQSLGPND